MPQQQKVPTPPQQQSVLQQHSRFNNLNQIVAKLNLNYMNIQLIKYHPRPSAVTTFNARLTDNGGGYALWNRRQDHIRHVLSQGFSRNEKLLRKNPGFIFAASSSDSSSQNEAANYTIQKSANSVQNLDKKIQSQIRTKQTSAVSTTPTSAASVVGNSPLIKQQNQNNFFFNETVYGREKSDSNNIKPMLSNCSSKSFDMQSNRSVKRNMSPMNNDQSKGSGVERRKMVRLDDFLSLNLIENDAVGTEEEYESEEGQDEVDIDDDELNFIYGDENKMLRNVGQSSMHEISSGSRNVVAGSKFMKLNSNSEDPVENGLIGHRTNMVSSDDSGKQKMLSTSLSLSPSPSSSSSASSSSNNGLILSSLSHHPVNQFSQTTSAIINPSISN